PHSLRGSLEMPAIATHTSNGAGNALTHALEPVAQQAEADYRVIRRTGSVTPFDQGKITVALTKAFLAVEGSAAAGSRRVHDVVEELTEQVVSALTRRSTVGRAFHVEDIQDQVELALMREGHHRIARAYVLYREERARERMTTEISDSSEARSIMIALPDGGRAPLDPARLRRVDRTRTRLNSSHVKISYAV